MHPDDLAALVVEEAVERAGIDPHGIDEVVLGAGNQAGEDNRNVARMATLLAGLAEPGRRGLPARAPTTTEGRRPRPSRPLSPVIDWRPRSDQGRLHARQPRRGPNRY